MVAEKLTYPVSRFIDLVIVVDKTFIFLTLLKRSLARLYPCESRPPYSHLTGSPCPRPLLLRSANWLQPPVEHILVSTTYFVLLSHGQNESQVSSSFSESCHDTLQMQKKLTVLSGQENSETRGNHGDNSRVVKVGPRGVWFAISQECQQDWSQPRAGTLYDLKYFTVTTFLK